MIRTKIRMNRMNLHQLNQTNSGYELIQVVESRLNLIFLSGGNSIMVLW